MEYKESVVLFKADNTNSYSELALNDNVRNYDYIEIYYDGNVGAVRNMYSEIGVNTGGRNILSVSLDASNASNTGIILRVITLTSTDNKLKITAWDRFFWYPSSSNWTHDNVVQGYISKVIGYR